MEQNIDKVVNDNGVSIAVKKYFGEESSNMTIVTDNGIEYKETRKQTGDYETEWQIPLLNGDGKVITKETFDSNTKKSVKIIEEPVLIDDKKIGTSVEVSTFDVTTATETVNRKTTTNYSGKLIEEEYTLGFMANGARKSEYSTLERNPETKVVDSSMHATIEYNTDNNIVNAVYRDKDLEIRQSKSGIEIYADNETVFFDERGSFFTSSIENYKPGNIDPESFILDQISKKSPKYVLGRNETIILPESLTKNLDELLKDNPTI